MIEKKSNRYPGVNVLFGLAGLFALTGCGITINLPQDATSETAAAAYLSLGTMSEVDLTVPLPTDTNIISALKETAVPIAGTCTTGSTVYVIDATSMSLVKSTECTASAFSTTLDLSSYADGAVSLKLIQVASSNSSSAYKTLNFTKETSYCKNPSNTGAVPNGTGGAGDPFLICTAEQMEGVFGAPNWASHFHLKNDLDLSSEPTLKGRFAQFGDDLTGVFDGKNFALYNYSGDTALIKSVYGTGVVKNVKMRDVNSTVAAASRFAVLVENYEGGAALDNISITGSVRIPDLGMGNTTGLIASRSTQSVTNSWVRASVSMAVQTGFVGVGMLIGEIGGGTSISNCQSYGDITADAAGSFGSFGGIVATVTQIWSAAAHTISDSTSRVSIFGGKYNGGIVGAAYPGTSLTISNSNYQGSLSGDHGTGGLLGSMQLATKPVHIVDSYALGDFTQPGECIGGLVGTAADQSTVTRSFYRGNVTSTKAGGWAGVGGLIGCTNGVGQVTDSYAVATVSSTGESAGLLGGWTVSGSTITTSYFIGTVSGGPAITQDATATINNVYYDTNQDTSTIGTGITADMFMEEANLAGFTFDSTHWKMGTQYPILYYE